MSKPANKIATYDDLFNIPDDVVGEIFGGELVTHPRPGPKHAQAASAVGALLFSRFNHKRSGDSEGLVNLAPFESMPFDLSILWA